MAIKVVPHAEEFSSAVEAFNRRMHGGGAKLGFYVSPTPDWIPRQEGASAWREFHLAVEDDGQVRGGYALKPQLWQIRGKTEWITDWQGPFSEGAINPRYATLALRLLRDMLRKYPLLFSLGHGGSDQPMVHLLRSLKWTLYNTPFCLKIRRPYRFLRYNAYLRRTRGREFLLDLLAFSGLGSLAVFAVQALYAVSTGFRRAQGTATVVESFGEWADDLWEQNKGKYRCLAVRDRKMMNTLLPQKGWPGGTRLRVDRDKKLVGWAVVHVKQMRCDPRFGELNVGLISDCFGAPEDSFDIIACAHSFLSAQGVDIVVSNQSHPEWVTAFRGNGFHVLANKRTFAISPEMQSRLEPFSDLVEGLHLTNMDGHGPHGFQ